MGQPEQNFQQVDGLIAIASSRILTPAERGEQLQQAAAEAQILVVPSREDLARGDNHKYWRAAGWLACLPSLERTAAGGNHDRAVAGKVFTNLQVLGKQVLDFQSTYGKSLEQGVAATNNGQAAELAVLGLLWWGSAHQSERSNLFALPATAAENASTNKAFEAKTGVDLKLYQSLWRWRCIQVKHTALRTTQPYAAHISVVQPNVLTNSGPGGGPDLPLLEALVDDNHKVLDIATQRLIRLLNNSSLKPALQSKETKAPAVVKPKDKARAKAAASGAKPNRSGKQKPRSRSNAKAPKKYKRR